MRLVTVIAILLFLVISKSSFSQESWFDHLINREISEVWISTTWDTLYENRRKDIEVDGTILWKEGDQNKTLNVELKLRGKFRRIRCVLAPLRLDLNKSELEQHGYTRTDKFKWVNQCSADSAGLQQLYRELLAYELWNELYPIGFRTHALTLHQQAENGDGIRKINGFLIEPPKTLAERKGLIKQDSFFLPQLLNEVEYARLALFQMMIGNSDWSVEMNKNLEYYVDSAGQYLVIPYDFDYSGWVSPSYARGNAQYRLRHGHDRVLIGQHKADILAREVSHMLNQKERILLKVKECPRINEESKMFLSHYLEDFFVQLPQLSAENNVLYFPPLKDNSQDE